MFHVDESRPYSTDIKKLVKDVPLLAALSLAQLRVPFLQRVARSVIVGEGVASPGAPSWGSVGTNEILLRHFALIVRVVPATMSRTSIRAIAGAIQACKGQHSERLGLEAGTREAYHFFCPFRHPWLEC